MKIGKKSDRVEFPGSFDFAAHANGFQIVYDDNYYSIIIHSDHEEVYRFQKRQNSPKWEMKDCDGNIKYFDDIRDAAGYIIRKEGFIPEVVDLESFYNLS